MLYRRDDSQNWYIKVKWQGRLFRKSTGTKDKAIAKRMHDAYRDEVRGISVYASSGDPMTYSLQWQGECNRAIKDSTSWLRRALNSANGRNKKRHGKRPMTKNEILNIALKSNGQCAVTGLPFTFEESRPGSRNPCGPSLDRVDSRYGYSRENCRWVLLAVNVAMGEWGEDTFWAISEAAVARKLREAAHIQLRAGTLCVPLDKYTVEPRWREVVEIKGENGRGGPI